MPILGIVLSLDPAAPDLGRETLERLQRVPNLELGERQGAKQPAVLECVDDSRTRSQVEAEIEDLLAIDGVLHVDVVFAEFEDLLPRSDTNATTVAAPLDVAAAPRETPEEPPRVMERESWT